MNPPSGSHEVRPEFRAHLEWQIESALRRETRFGAPAGGRMPRLRVAILVMASLAVGGMAVAASGELQDARQRDQLIETAISEEALVRLRVDLARADYQDARSRFDIGTADRQTVQAAERQLRAMEARARAGQARHRGDSDDIGGAAQRPSGAAGRAAGLRARSPRPRTGHGAAVAGGRRTSRWRSTGRVEVGTAPPAAQLNAEAELARARARLQQLHATLELRQRFLSGGIKVEELAQTQRRMELTLQREQLQREIEIARRRVEEIRGNVEIGQATQLDLRRAEVVLLEREAELQRIRRELEMVAGRSRKE